MKLTKIKIENFRLLKNSEIGLDDKLTLLVGKNNSAKTTLMNLLKTVLRGQNINYNDYPLSERMSLNENFYKLVNGKLSIEEFINLISLLKLTLTIDYSLIPEEDHLGGLSPFIIDLDEGSNEAIIEVVSEFTYDKTKNVKDDFEKFVIDVKSSQDVLKENFNRLFRLNVKAINPSNKDDFQYKEMSDLKSLFPFFTISAERSLDEADDSRYDSSLKGVISNFFSANIDDVHKQIKKEVNELRKIVIDVNNELQSKSSEKLSNLVNNSIGFGYPNINELKLGVETSINIDEQITNNSVLTYEDEKNGKLPNSHNGLGFKNLIKMQFQLARILKELEETSYSTIPLIFIEEPESHMHPQMQTNFINYITEYIDKLSDLNIQMLITTHSPHIANSVQFSKIRYSKRINDNIVFLNLGNFEKDQKNKDNQKFLTKYLTITRCDMFFADKIILVEGSTERLLIPDIINKLHIKKEFDAKYDLSNQYYTVIEVGGAYAHIFIPFLNFLNTPSLIITDIDSGSKTREKTTVTQGLLSTNATINHWYKYRKNKKKNPTLNEIISLNNEEKTILNCHIEFQTTEKNICARSLEGALQNVNREQYKLQSLDDIKLENKILVNISSKEKTEFIMDLIFKKNDYVIPDYILTGIKWLSNIDNPNKEATNCE